MLFFAGKETQANEELPVLISSFSSKVVKLRVAKKADKHDEELLQSESGSDSPGGGLWNSITSTLTGSTGNEADKDEPLNIFCLASGHLYERLLKIMILSVQRTTQLLVGAKGMGVSQLIWLLLCPYKRSFTAVTR